MKTNFHELSFIIQAMIDDDFMMDHDLNLVIVNSNVKRSIVAHLDIKNHKDVSRFLTMVICFSENGIINPKIIVWNNDEYDNYLRNGEIDDESDRQYVEEFLKNF